MAGFPGCTENHTSRLWKRRRRSESFITGIDKRRCPPPVEDVSAGARTLRADDFHVEMSQSAGDGQSQDDHGLYGERVPVQVVVERAVLVVLGHQPELRPGAAVCSSRRHKHSVLRCLRQTAVFPPPPSLESHNLCCRRR